VADTCECGNKLSGSVKCGEFLIVMFMYLIIMRVLFCIFCFHCVVLCIVCM